jgi:hypothetical protein
MSNVCVGFGFGIYANYTSLIEVARELQTWINEASEEMVSDATAPNDSEIPQVAIGMAEYAAGIDVDNETIWDSETCCEEELSFGYVKKLFIKKCEQFSRFAETKSSS